MSNFYLEDELLVAGTLPPSRLASPGPAKAPRPPSIGTEKTVCFFLSKSQQPVFLDCCMLDF